MTGMQQLYLLVPLAPLVGSLVAGLFGWLIGRTWSHRVTIALMMVSFAASVVVFVDVLRATPSTARSTPGPPPGKRVSRSAS
ncbi:MAG: hypothetical protein KatS3mg123_1167 [Burkholderiales bacterium]|nr:MAG: hypothetical protein KatS3mg123_1167 [Burkholderiales bacterium]